MLTESEPGLISRVAYQLPIPEMVHLAHADKLTPCVSRRRSTVAVVDTDPLGSFYLRRLRARGVAPAGYKAYRYQLESMLRIAARLRKSEVGLSDLLQDIDLLGQVLIDEIAPTTGETVSKWTLAQRRSAARSFVSLMSPEVGRILDGDPLERIDVSLRSVAERVGTDIG